MLTTRETEILTLIARKGFTNAEVGAAIGCTEKTVKVHVGNLFTKMNVTNRVRMVLKFHGLLEQ